MKFNDLKKISNNQSPLEPGWFIVYEKDDVALYGPFATYSHAMQILNQKNLKTYGGSSPIPGSDGELITSDDEIVYVEYGKIENNKFVEIPLT